MEGTVIEDNPRSGVRRWLPCSAGSIPVCRWPKSIPKSMTGSTGYGRCPSLACMSPVLACSGLAFRRPPWLPHCSSTSRECSRLPVSITATSRIVRFVPRDRCSLPLRCWAHRPCSAGHCGGRHIIGITMPMRIRMPIRIRRGKASGVATPAGSSPAVDFAPTHRVSATC